MNLHHRVSTAVYLICLVYCTAALAQPAAPPAAGGLAASIKTGAQVDAAGKEAIKKFIADQAKKLADPSPDVDKSGRDLLISESRVGGQMPGPAYASEYSKALAAEMTNLLVGSASPRTKLIAAVVIGKVAESLHDRGIEKAITALLNERHEALQLWGIKAAKAILPELVTVSGEGPVINAIVAAVKMHPSGPMFQEAFDALMPHGLPPAKAGAFVGGLHALLHLRLDTYKVKIPEDPEKDYLPFNFLKDNWTAMPPAQQVETMQLLCDMLTLAAAHGDNPNNRLMRDQFQNIVVQGAGALFVIANTIGNAPLVTAAQNANKMAKGVAGGLGAAVAPLCQAISAVKGFEKIKPPEFTPPTMAPTTNPSAAPAPAAPVVAPAK